MMDNEKMATINEIKLHVKKEPVNM